MDHDSRCSALCSLLSLIAVPCACTQVRTLMAAEVFTIADLELLLTTQTEERFDRNFAESGVTAAKVRKALTLRGLHCSPAHPETAGSCAGVDAPRREQPALIVDWSPPSATRSDAPPSITNALERAGLGSPSCAPVTPMTVEREGEAALEAVHRFTRYLHQFQEREGEAAALKAASGTGSTLPRHPPDAAYCADIVAQATGYWKAKHEQAHYNDFPLERVGIAAGIRQGVI